MKWYQFAFSSPLKHSLISPLCFRTPSPTIIIMNSVVAILALIGAASAGLVGPAVYSSGPAYASYAAPAYAPVVAKAVVPAATSYQTSFRAPAAKVAVAAPVYHHAPAFAAPAYAAPAYAAQAYAAPAYAAHPVAHAVHAPVHHAVAAHPVAVGHAVPVVHQTFSTPYFNYGW